MPPPIPRPSLLQRFELATQHLPETHKNTTLDSLEKFLLFVDERFRNRKYLLAGDRQKWIRVLRPNSYMALNVDVRSFHGTRILAFFSARTRSIVNVERLWRYQSRCAPGWFKQQCPSFGN